MSRIGAPDIRSRSTTKGPSGVSHPTSARSPRRMSRTTDHVVDPIEPEVIADGQIGRLDVEGVRRAPAIPVERRDRPLAVRAHQVRDLLRLDPSEVQPVRERDEVAGEPVPADVRALPDGLATGRGGGFGERPAPLGAAGISTAVGADDEQRCSRPIARERRPLTRVQGGGVLDPIEDRGPEPCLAGVHGEADQRVVPVLREAVGLPDQQHTGAGPAFEAPELPAQPRRQPGVEEPVAAPRPRVLDQHPVTDRGGRPGERFPGRETPQRAAIVERGHAAAQCPPTIVSTPSRTRRRTRTARLAASGRCCARSRTASTPSSPSRAI